MGKNTGELVSTEFKPAQPTNADHNKLINKMRSKFTRYFLLNRINICEVPLSEEVLNRSVADVLESPPELKIPKEPSETDIDHFTEEKELI
jgi:hypothetical protein